MLAGETYMLRSLTNELLLRIGDFVITDGAQKLPGSLALRHDRAAAPILPAAAAVHWHVLC
jgi:hypothetical protein